MRYEDIDFKRFGDIQTTLRSFYALKKRLKEKNIDKIAIQKKKEEIHAIINNAVYPPASKQV